MWHITLHFYKVVLQYLLSFTVTTLAYGVSVKLVTSGNLTSHS